MHFQWKSLEGTMASRSCAVLAKAQLLYLKVERTFLFYSSVIPVTEFWMHPNAKESRFGDYIKHMFSIWRLAAKCVRCVLQKLQITAPYKQGGIISQPQAAVFPSIQMPKPCSGKRSGSHPQLVLLTQRLREINIHFSS